LQDGRVIAVIFGAARDSFKGTLQMYHQTDLRLGNSMNLAARLFCGLSLIAASLSAAFAEEAQVVSAVSTLSYTFIEIERDGKTMWLAADVIPLKPGDRISFEEGILMMNFRSSDLERTFPNMTFIEKVKVIEPKQ